MENCIDSRFDSHIQCPNIFVQQSSDKRPYINSFIDKIGHIHNFPITNKKKQLSKTLHRKKKEQINEQETMSRGERTNEGTDNGK